MRTHSSPNPATQLSPDRVNLVALETGRGQLPAKRTSGPRTYGCSLPHPHHSTRVTCLPQVRANPSPQRAPDHPGPVLGQTPASCDRTHLETQTQERRWVLDYVPTMACVSSKNWPHPPGPGTQVHPQGKSCHSID